LARGQHRRDRVSLMPVFLFLVAALVSIPLAELYVLLEIGRSIGAGTTIALVVLTAVLGAWLLRWQGLATIARAQAVLKAGELPAVELVEGLILLLTGVMLLTPGFITDAIGFMCLLPAVRRHIARGFAARMIVRNVQHRRAGGRADAHTIDGEYEVDNNDHTDLLK
jgi:UPF0716 protein FxsA